MRTPLNLTPNDNSKDAALARVNLHIHMSGLTGGRGFRQSGKNSAPTRIERIATEAYSD